MCHGNCSRNGSETGTFQRNSLRVGSMSSIPYNREVVRCPRARHVLWRYFDMLHTLTLRSLRSIDSCWALTTTCVQWFIILMPQTLHDAVEKAVAQGEFSFIKTASEAKQKVGGRVIGCALNLGELSRGSTCAS
jgi:hypothetical protein